MEDIKTTIIEQLNEVQFFMNRSMGVGLCPAKKGPNPLKGQGRILKLLKMKPTITQRELDYLLDMSKQSLSELLAKLEEKGYITREQSEDDKRGLTIHLTEEGHKVADNVDETPAQAAHIFECLSDDELQAFSGYLSRLIKRFEDQFPGEDFEERREMMRKFMAGQHGGHHGGKHGNHHGGKHDEHPGGHRGGRRGGHKARV